MSWGPVLRNAEPTEVESSHTDFVEPTSTAKLATRSIARATGPAGALTRFYFGGPQADEGELLQA
jgi:hypothetical protein